MSAVKITDKEKTTEREAVKIKRKDTKQSFLSGAFTLVIATVIVKIIGAIYKIPLYNILTPQGTAYFSTAYNVYLPIYVLATAGLPAAVSRMVSAQYSTGNYKNIRRILKIALAFFLCTGIAGAVVMFFFTDMMSGLSGALTSLSAKIAQSTGWTPTTVELFSPDAIYAIRALSPTLLFVCLMSAFRGYYEGLRDMHPTAYSQVIETVCKLGFGLFLANAPIKHGLAAFEAGMPVYGKVCETMQQAKEACLPYAAAGGIAGVTIGAFVGLCYLILYYKIKGDGVTAQQLADSPNADSNKRMLRSLLKIAIPIGIGAIALNLSGLIDNITINARMTSLIQKFPDYFQNMYSSVISDPKVGAGSLDKLPNYLWGLYGYGLVFYNLIPMITLNFGISALPAVTHYWTIGDHEKLHENIERAIRVTALIAYPGALGLAVLSKPILTIFYERSMGTAGVAVATPLLQILAITLIFGALCTPLGSILQGLGRPDLQVKIVFGGIGIKLLTNFILIGIPQFNINGAPIGTFMCYAFIFFCELWYTCSIGKINLNFRKTFFKPLACATLCAAAAYGGYLLTNKVFSLSAVLSTAAAIIAGVVVYVVSLFLFRAISKEDVLSLPKGKNIAKVLEKHHLIG